MMVFAWLSLVLDSPVGLQLVLGCGELITENIWLGQKKRQLSGLPWEY